MTKEQEDKRVAHYAQLGMKVDVTFPGEYILMHNMGTMDCARVYFDGRVWEKMGRACDYVKISAETWEAANGDT